MLNAIRDRGRTVKPTTTGKNTSTDRGSLFVTNRSGVQIPPVASTTLPSKKFNPNAESKALPTKRNCTICGAEKPLEDFYRHSIGKYGRNPECKECTKARMRRYKRSRVVTNHHRRHPERARCRSIVNEAIKAGRLLRQPCQVCGTTHRVQAHHTDYSKPLEVVWLCSFHHGEEHRRLGKQEGKAA